MKSPRSFLALTFLLVATNTGSAYAEPQEQTRDIPDPIQILEPGETHCERLGKVINDAHALRQNISNIMEGEQQKRQERVMRKVEELLAHHDLKACILGLNPPGQ